MGLAGDLNYDPNSFAGPFNESELRSFENWLHASGFDKINFDPSYVSHLKSFHGGMPGKRYFVTAAGTDDAVERFLNFLAYRSGHRLVEYSVECTWSNINDRLTDSQMPFAELFAGDYLCFDFETGNPGKVVMWFHELSREGKPHTEFVANSFEEFLDMLSDVLPSVKPT